MKQWVFVLAMVGMLVGCGLPPDGDDDDDDNATPTPTSTSHPDGPQILNFATNVTEITEDQGALFSAVVTDPDGVEDLIGGTLSTPNGAVYGNFVPDGTGTYTIQLSWSQINQGNVIEFQSEENRSFVAEFFDVAGHVGASSAGLRLHCDGVPATAGACWGIQSNSYTVQQIDVADNGCDFDTIDFQNAVVPVEVNGTTIAVFGVEVSETATAGTYAGAGQGDNDHNPDFDCVERVTATYDVVMTGPDAFDFRYRFDQMPLSGAQCQEANNGVPQPCSTDITFELRVD